MKKAITILTTTVILLSAISPLMSKSVSADQLSQTSDTHKRVKRANQGWSPNNDYSDYYKTIYGGPTYPVQGTCPSNSINVGYIGGGQNLCKFKS